MAEPLPISDSEKKQAMKSLTERQKQILSLFCQRKKQYEIAISVHLSVQAVRGEMRSIYQALQLADADPSLKPQLLRQHFCLDELMTMFAEEGIEDEAEEAIGVPLSATGHGSTSKASVEVPTPEVSQKSSATLSSENGAAREESEHRSGQRSLVANRTWKFAITAQRAFRLSATIIVILILVLAFRYWQGASSRSEGDPVAVRNAAPAVLATIPQDSLLLADFENGIPDVYAANDWGDDEVALAVHPSADGAAGHGAMQADFDFGRTTATYPRATFFLTHFPTGNWSPYNQLIFSAKSLVELRSNIRVTVALATGPNSCWNEAGDFQFLALEYQVLTYDLDLQQFKTCEDDKGYSLPLLDSDQVMRLHWIVMAEHQPSGAILIDEVRLLRR